MLVAITQVIRRSGALSSACCPAAAASAAGTWVSTAAGAFSSAASAAGAQRKMGHLLPLPINLLLMISLIREEKKRQF